MITGYIKGQELKIRQPIVASDTIDYLTAEFSFLTDDWKGLEKWVHFAKGDEVYDVLLTNDRIAGDAHLNLSAGEWEIYLHGNRYVNGTVAERVTTAPAYLTVEQTGTLEGEPFPTVTPSAGEQIIAQAVAARDVAMAYADAAEENAAAASASKSAAASSASSAVSAKETAVIEAESAAVSAASASASMDAAAESATKAEECKKDIEDMTVSSHALLAGSEPTVEKTKEDGKPYNLDFGIPSCGVHDVQVAGNSIVTDGIANIPIATVDSFGLIRASRYDTGIQLDPSGYLKISPASNDAVDGRYMFRPITPMYLDYAVKAAMCDGKGAAWTADEQAAARERMGIDKSYELIEEITLEEDVNAIIREWGSLGTLYKSVILFLSATASTSSDATWVSFGFKNWLPDSVRFADTFITTSSRNTTFKADDYNGIKIVIYGYENKYSGIKGVSNAAGKGIGFLDIRRSNSALIPAGTNIKIYGVRA